MATLYVTDTAALIIDRINRQGPQIQVIFGSDEGPVIDGNQTDPDWSGWWQRYAAAGGPALVTSPREAVRLDLHAKVRAAIAGNQTALGNVATAAANVQGVIDGTAANITQANTMLDTLAQTMKAMLTQQERIMRQVTALERLLIGSDLLVENTDT